MKIEHLDEGVGRIVKGVNTTPDVGVNQTSIEAAKFGNKVDKDGRPPTLSSKVKGKSTNVLFNLGLTEDAPRYTAAEWAIMEGGHSLEDKLKPVPSISQLVKKHGVPASQILKQLEMGIEAEMEHTNDFDIAQKIALAHIDEDPAYYDKLKFIENVEIDNRDGWGAVPWNQEIDYRGLRVKMKPSVFINLAASRNGEPPVPKVVQHIKDGGAIGAPFLQIFVDEDDSQIPEVRGHEGRSRMAAILEVHGDVPVEVHLFFQGKVNRNRHITPEFVEKIQRYLISENDKMIRGPLFEI